MLEVPDVLGLGPPYHVGIATRRLEAAMDALSEVFGCGWTEVREGAEPGLASPSGPLDWTARVTFSFGGEMHLELLEGSPGSVWQVDAVARLHHYAFWTDDVARDVARLERDGWAVEITFFDDRGHPRNMAYLRKPGSPRIELVDSVRRPSFLERVGAT